MARPRLWGFLTWLAVLVPAVAPAQGPGYAGHPIYPGPHPYGGGVPAAHWSPECPPDAALTQTTYELLPEDRFHRPHPEWSSVGQALQKTWIRFEYLNFGIEDPGDKLLGAPMLSEDERGQFLAIDRSTGAVVGFGTTPDTRGFDLSDNNGIRAALGLPTRVGTFEANVWVLEQADSAISMPPDLSTVGTLGLPLFAVTPLQNQGVASDTTMIVYDQDYRATLRSELFGTEAMFIFNPVTPNQHLMFHGLIGFNYFHFRERLVINGAGTDPNTLVVLDHLINAASWNNIFGPSIGFRAELHPHERVTLGVTPKFILGVNRHKEQVFTEQIFDVDEGRLLTKDTDSDFAPAFDLSVYGRVKMTEHLSVFVSYQLYLLSQVGRPYDNIVYNDLGIGSGPGIILDAHRQNMVVQGLTVGGEFHF